MTPRNAVRMDQAISIGYNICVEALVLGSMIHGPVVPNPMISLTVLHELDRSFHDSWPKPTRTSPKVRLFSARGAHAGVQLLVGAEDGIEIRAQPLRRKGGGQLPKGHAYHVRFVPLEENTVIDAGRSSGQFIGMTSTKLTAQDRKHVVRAAPCEIAEVLVPAKGCIREPNHPTVLFVDYCVPGDTKPGIYHSSVELRSGKERASIPVELEVYAATLPKQQKLSITNWFNLQRIADVHGVKMWSEPYWTLLGKYARLMAAHRQTMFWLQPQVYGINVVNGKVRLNFNRLERYIKLFLDEGFTQIEGAHVSRRHSLKDSVTFLYWASQISDEDAWRGWKTRKSNEKKADVLGPVPTTMDGHALLRQWLTPFWDFLGKRGWQGKYYQHVFDEPLPQQADHYRHLSLIVRQLMPAVKIMDAVHIEAINGSNDCVVPSNLGGARQERKLADNNRRIGVETWYYTCCGPRGPWLNRFLDYPLIRTRLLPWYNYITRTTGYLHWGLNMYRAGVDPWKQTVPVHPEKTPDGALKLPPGDTHVVWPGENQVYGSLRFTAMRNGIEDYELLALIAGDPKRAPRGDRIVDKVIRNGKSYLQDPIAFDRYRRQLLNLASK